VPGTAYFGIQTQRALRNFCLTGQSIGKYPELIQALAMVKKAAARINAALGDLDQAQATAICVACDEIIAGELHDQFVVDLIQGGAGTSTNMNANEVIANRALEHLGYTRGQYQHLHPNNHVNLSQSTNDAYPTALRIALVLASRPLSDSLAQLIASLRKKAQAFSSVIKMGRTQLQDAVPMTLGQEFSAFAITLEEDQQRLHEIHQLLAEVNLGGTAIGTGINSRPEYRSSVVKALAEISGLALKPAHCPVEATTDCGVFITLSGLLKRLAVKLSKISNDLRLLSSGPHTGFGEIRLPPMQPGSSIMPGKVNPVIPEAVNQVAYQVIGSDLSVTMAAEAGQLQLNAMEPLIAYNLLQSLRLMTAAITMLDNKCIQGIEANREHCARLLQNSIGIITALNPYIGYDNASRIAKQALETGARVSDLILEEGLMDEELLDRVLQPRSLAGLRP